MPLYDVMVLGHVSKDINITPEGTEYSTGGAVVYSSIAIYRQGARVLAVTKLHPDDFPVLEIFGRFGTPVIHRPSANTTSIQNTYLTADREQRRCEALGMADPFGETDLPENAEAALYYMGGLIRGEFPEEFIAAMAQRGPIAVDVQGFLRVNEGGPMVFRDWERKREFIPLIHYLKTDAAEARILTGAEDPNEAAAILADWGAREIVLTHNEGLIIRVAGKQWAFPWTSRNLSGRTGRGDTCFCTYCYQRLRRHPEDAGCIAAAVTSLKMETPGPFSGTPEDIHEAIQSRYGRSIEKI
jgi:sugar/nucleoside kinase (ribokinase family)